MEKLTHSMHRCQVYYYVIYLKWCLFIYPERDLILLFYLIGILLFFLICNIFAYNVVPYHWYFTFLLILLEYAWNSVGFFSIRIVTFVLKMVRRGFHFPNISLYYIIIFFWGKGCNRWNIIHILTYLCSKPWYFFGPKMVAVSIVFLPCNLCKKNRK